MVVGDPNYQTGMVSVLSHCHQRTRREEVRVDIGEAGEGCVTGVERD